VQIAAQQHGVIARRQLVELGLGRGAIRHRLAAGRLHRIHPGTYAVGHPHVTDRGRWMAAVLAFGDDALLSHRSAAAVWGFGSGAGSRIDVTALGRSRHGLPGVVLHQVRRLDPRDRAVRDRLPVTSVARTLLDLAEVVQARQLERSFEEAERLHLLDLAAILRLRDRSPGRRGLRALDALLSDHRTPPPETRSELEQRFVEFCREVGLPSPANNVSLAGFEVDAFWPGTRLVVELDGYAFHRTRGAFERDRARDTALQVAGYRILRVTSRRLVEEPVAVADAIRSLLEQMDERPISTLSDL
jgi:predicted transcriptional regulator of viral defense system